MTKKTVKKTSKRVHVISSGDYWAVKREGASRASKVYTKKDIAVRSAKKLRANGHDVVVHKRDGTIQKWEKSKK